MNRYRRDQARPGEILHAVGDLWEVRVKLGTNPYRVLFFHDSGRYIVALTAFYKNQQKLPPKQRKKAEQRLSAYKAERQRRRKAYERMRRDSNGGH